MITVAKVIGKWDFLGIAYDVIEIEDNHLIGPLYGTIPEGANAVGLSPYEVRFQYDPNGACKNRAEWEILNLAYNDTARRTHKEGQELINAGLSAWEYVHHGLVKPYIFQGL